MNQIIIHGVSVLCALIVGILVLMIGGRHPPKRILGKCSEFSGMLRTRTQNSSWYMRKKEKLIRNGAAYHLGERIAPVSLLAVDFSLGAVGFCVGTLLLGRENLVVAFALGLGMGALPEILVTYFNKRDNEKMLPELRTIYLALSLQIKAGVYVTDALAECYASVSMERLRKALLDLASDIVMKADIFEALNSFQRKFENRYIDSLCITILQAMESGQAVELLSDISNQVRDMESTVLTRRKGRLDRSLTFYQLGLLSAVMLVALYACVSYMLGSSIFV